MIYWYTGQPGHGKTLHAIARAMEFKAQGRMVYVCNVRQFNYEKTGMQKMTPEQFRDWMNFLPDGAVALVDEAYEHEMLPKRAPGAKLPLHVERLATHRHRGLDFIFVCQSPDKQVDQFVHDLIERHVHVRRRFGTKFVHQREFDRYEKNPEKATPLTTRRGQLPKKSMGTYESTELDTTEKRIPWYYFALAIGVPLSLWYSYHVFGSMGKRLGGNEAAPVVVANDGGQAIAKGTTEPKGDGGPARASLTPAEYVASFTPRIPSQPWTAAAYDGNLQLAGEAPRVFCMSSGSMRGKLYQIESCTCLTEQGTRYHLDLVQCATVAREGQYEPYFDERDTRYTDAGTMREKALESNERISGKAATGTKSSVQMNGYGAMGYGPNAGGGDSSPR